MGGSSLRNRKSQIFSLDMLIAMLAFVVILTSSIMIWDYSIETISSKERRNELELASIHVLSSLIETTGIPSNWNDLPLKDFNETNIHAIGLVKNSPLGLNYKGPWEIDLKKINYLNSSTYNKTKKILGLEGYNFNLTIKKYDGNNFVFNYSVGGNISNATEVISLTRYALLDSQKAELILKVGRNE